MKQRLHKVISILLIWIMMINIIIPSTVFAVNGEEDFDQSYYLKKTKHFYIFANEENLNELSGNIRAKMGESIKSIEIENDQERLYIKTKDKMSLAVFSTLIGYYKGHSIILGVYSKDYFKRNEDSILKVIAGKESSPVTSNGSITVNKDFEAIDDVSEFELIDSQVANKNQIIVKMKDKKTAEDNWDKLRITMSAVSAFTSAIEEDAPKSESEIEAQKKALEGKLEQVQSKLDEKGVALFRSSTIVSEEKKTKIEETIGDVQIVEIDEVYDVEEFAEELEADPDIEYAQPNYKLNIFDVDPNIKNQWGIINLGQNIGGEEGVLDKDSGVNHAWNFSKGENVVVAVLDTGVDINHTDLKNNIYVNQNEIPDNGIDDDNNGFIDDVNGWDFYYDDASVYDSKDFDKHGTHIAGVIASEWNGEGTIGVSPKAKILPLKFIGPSGGYTSDAIRAIEYAKAQKVQIMNCSFGSVYKNLALEEAMRSSEILFVTAAGNKGWNLNAKPVYPASYNLDNVITVGATTNKGTHADFSNYGDSVDILAPGKNIYSTVPSNKYAYDSGTSQSAGYVSAAAALKLKLNESLTAEQLKSEIVNKASNMGLRTNVLNIENLIVPSTYNNVVSPGAIQIHTLDNGRYALATEFSVTSEGSIIIDDSVLLIDTHLQDDSNDSYNPTSGGAIHVDDFYIDDALFLEHIKESTLNTIKSKNMNTNWVLDFVKDRYLYEFTDEELELVVKGFDSATEVHDIHVFFAEELNKNMNDLEYFKELLKIGITKLEFDTGNLVRRAFGISHFSVYRDNSAFADHDKWMNDVNAQASIQMLKATYGFNEDTLKFFSYTLDISFAEMGTVLENYSTNTDIDYPFYYTEEMIEGLKNAETITGNDMFSDLPADEASKTISDSGVSEEVFTILENKGFNVNASVLLGRLANETVYNLDQVISASFGYDNPYDFEYSLITVSGLITMHDLEGQTVDYILELLEKGYDGGSIVDAFDVESKSIIESKLIEVKEDNDVFVPFAEQDEIDLQSYINPTLNVREGNILSVNPESGNLRFDLNIGSITTRNLETLPINLSYRSDDASKSKFRYDKSSGDIKQYFSDSLMNFAIAPGWHLNMTYFNGGNHWRGGIYEETDIHNGMNLTQLHLADGRVVNVKRKIINGKPEYEILSKNCEDITLEVCDTATEVNEFRTDDWINLGSMSGYYNDRFPNYPSLKVMYNTGVIEYINYEGKLIGQKDIYENGYEVRYQFDHFLGTAYRAVLLPKKIVGNHGMPIEFEYGSSIGATTKITQGTKRYVLTKSGWNVSQIILQEAVLAPGDELRAYSDRTYKNADSYSFEYTQDYEGEVYADGRTKDLQYDLISKVTLPTGVSAVIDDYDKFYMGIDGYGSIERFHVGNMYYIDKNGKKYYEREYTASKTRGSVSKYTPRGEVDYTFDDDATYIEYFENGITGPVKVVEINYDEETRWKENIITTYFDKSSSSKRTTMEKFTYYTSGVYRGLLKTHTNIEGIVTEYGYTQYMNADGNSIIRTTSVIVKDETGKMVSQELNEYFPDGEDESGLLIKKTIGIGDEKKVIEYDNQKYDWVKETIVHNPDLNIHPMETRSYVSSSFYGTDDESIDRGSSHGIIGRPLKSAYSKDVYYDETNTKSYINYVKNYYDKNLRVIQTKDQHDNITLYEYDNRHRLTKIINPDTTYATLEYDDVNNHITMTDEDDVKVRTTFDIFGNHTKTEKYLNGTWVIQVENTYNKELLLETSKDANGNVTSYLYDGYDRPIKITAPNGAVTSIGYNDFAKTVTTTGPDGQKSIEYFDDMGRTIKTEIYNETEVITTINVYNTLGQLRSTKDAGDNVYNYDYDEFGRLIKVTDPLLQVSEYKYNHLDQLVETKVTDATTGKEYINTKTYDHIGRLIANVDEKSKAQTFAYDDMSRVIKTVDKLGQATNTTYDIMGRIKTVENITEKFEYEYTNAGKVELVKHFPDKTNTANVLETKYSYYTDGLLKTKTNPDNKVLSYTYDNGGNVTSINDFLGLVTNYTYTNLSKIDTITVGSKTFDYDYHTDGMIKSIQYPTGALRTDFIYDTVNRLTNISNTKSNVAFHESEYKYDDQSNITEKTDNNRNRAYTYDALNRMEKVKDHSRSLTHDYTYDVRGNIKTESANYNIAPTIETGSYTWNARGYAESFTNDAGDNYTYKYSHDGLRTSKSKNGLKIADYYYQASGRIINEVSGGKIISVVWGHLPLMRVIDGQCYYYFYNGHGDITKVTDETGKVVNWYDYDEWGKIIAKEETVNNDLTYFGQIFDDESGNYYLRARYYNPQMRRFISRDSYEGVLTNPLTMNQYIYCLNNPLGYVDLDGRKAIRAVDPEGIVTWYFTNLCVGVFESSDFKRSADVFQNVDKVQTGFATNASDAQNGNLEYAIGEDGSKLYSIEDLKKLDKEVGKSQAWIALKTAVSTGVDTVSVLNGGATSASSLKKGGTWLKSIAKGILEAISPTSKTSRTVFAVNQIENAISDESIREKAIGAAWNFVPFTSTLQGISELTDTSKKVRFGKADEKSYIIVE
ncbi:S8 family serine peptidase [Fusibacter sp. JL216-2]|uniref:S8 family serine peptidase n=1 Tax=Fusibacter sp. JL216-2 TaxID=3071453 RepID=UPI003D34F85E